MQRDQLILTVNGGSSSLKVALYENTADLERLTRETIASDRDGGARAVTAWASRSAAGREIGVVAHRLVHGGEAFDRACRVDPDIVVRLKALIPLAPNHLPAELDMLDALSEALPHAAHVACFDTAFHRTLPAVARILPLPGVRRFGFHGLSYTFLVSELERIAGRAAAHGRVILAHLGSGASVSAVKDGRSVDTSMGMTPAGGLVMSTRAGDVDPCAVTYVMRRDGLSPDDMDRLLTTHSGLAALAGTGDMRTLLAREAEDPRAKAAIDVFCYQAAKWIGAFAAALGGLDTLVFSGGIGEQAPDIRARILERVVFLGITLDDAANRRHAPVISSAVSRIAVRVIPTDEALVMARQARAVLTPSQENFHD